MEYRLIGNTGLKVSVLGFGNMNIGSNPWPQELHDALIKRCWDHGINFFDTAEMYDGGVCETILGKSIKALGVPREDLVITTKIFKGGKGVNAIGLSRKHLIEGVRNSLKRLQLDYVDLIYCHRPDHETPLEETCRAMDWIVRHGYAHYWGTPEWSASRLIEAIGICERLGLVRPVVEQPQYNMFVREKVEVEYVPVYNNWGLGTTVWSPLAGGVLTGKYNEGIPDDSRLTRANAFMKEKYFKNFIGDDVKDKTFSILKQLDEVAKSLGATLAQLALAWCIYNKDTTVTLFGSTKLDQIDDNVKAVEVYKKITPEIYAKIETILSNKPDPGTNFRTWKPLKSRV
jgi:voltage-dependent potassium channel beta subunit